MFNALRKLFVDEATSTFLKAKFLEEDMTALTKRGVRAAWSILMQDEDFKAKMIALAKEAIEEDKEDKGTT